MKKILLSLVVAALAGGGIFYVLTLPGQISVDELESFKNLKANSENGRYMFYAGGCASCHAKPAKNKCDEPNYTDAFDLSGGRCLKTPFGTFNVPNISPNQKLGIGSWSHSDFILAMRKGVSPGGKHYYPAFPYTSYQKMTSQDLVDLQAFLGSLAPKAVASLPHDLKLPFRFRRGLGLWKRLYLASAPFKNDPSLDTQLNRGRYLVEGPGHCSECHSPRDSFGGIITARKFGGSKALEGKGYIPNLTPHKDGIADWSAKDIAYSLKTGFMPDYDSFGSSMVKVQENMAHLTDADRAAIAAYLKSLKPIARKK